MPNVINLSTGLMIGVAGVLCVIAVCRLTQALQDWRVRRFGMRRLRGLNRR